MDWLNSEMQQNAHTAVRHNMYACDAIDFLFGQQETSAGRDWVSDNSVALTKWFVSYGLEE